jgi:hypothetical protein
MPTNYLISAEYMIGRSFNYIMKSEASTNDLLAKLEKMMLLKHSGRTA